ncbi:MAG: hypothetical protein FWC19_02080 [Treponema sp.]|nr:hypothetical protein [Treponema sp.]
MKKIFLIILLLICSQINIFSQNTDLIDLILVLNSSSGMSSSYDNVNNYITGSFLSEFLRVGDTFHLIPFSENPRIDVARRITSQGDVETIVGRMLLQYPVESGSNLGPALTFTEQYVRALPVRPKKIVVVSTGNSESTNLINSSKQRLGSNTTLDFIQVTPGQALTNLPSSGRRTGAVGTTVRTTGTAVTAGAAWTTGAATGTGITNTAGTATAATGITDTAGTTGTASTGTTGIVDTTETAGTSVTSDAGTIWIADTTTDTGTMSIMDTTGTAQIAGTSETIGTTSTADTTGTTGTTGTQSSRINSSSVTTNLPVIIGIIIGILLLLALIIYLLTRRLRSGPNRVMASAASTSAETDKSRFADHSNDLAKYAAVQTKQRTTPYADRPLKSDNAKSVVINPNGPLLLNLFVEDQNTAIGKRNIHSLKSGYSLSIGGENSDFLIFLVPIPPRIGDLRRNGSQLTLIPRKPKYFPDLGTSELHDCLNKTVRIVSDKGYEMRFRFETYEDPLLVLNRMLTTINVPG